MPRNRVNPLADAVTENMDRMARKAATLKAKAERMYKMVDAAHERADEMHQRLRNLNERVRNQRLERDRSRKKAS